MNKPDADSPISTDNSETELPPIEFVAQGSFSIHNPETPSSNPCSAADRASSDSQQLIKADGIEAIRSHSLALLQQAQHNLCIYSPDLEAWLYNHSSIQQACSKLLLAHPKNSLRILVRDSSEITRNGHRLLTLSHRLSSRCSIRKVNIEHDYSEDSWLIADRNGLFIRKAQQLQQGLIYYHNPVRTEQSLREFDAMWNVSQVDLTLRSMLL